MLRKCHVDLRSFTKAAYALDSPQSLRKNADDDLGRGADGLWSDRMAESAARRRRGNGATGILRTVWTRGRRARTI
jgi:hypothetical protein